MGVHHPVPKVAGGEADGGTHDECRKLHLVGGLELGSSSSLDCRILRMREKEENNINYLLLAKNKIQGCPLAVRALGEAKTVTIQTFYYKEDPL